MIGIWTGNISGDSNKSVYLRWDRVDGFYVYDTGVNAWVGFAVVGGKELPITSVQNTKSDAEDAVTDLLSHSIDPLYSADFETSSSVVADLVSFPTLTVSQES